MAHDVGPLNVACNLPASRSHSGTLGTIKSLLVFRSADAGSKPLDLYNEFTLRPCFFRS